MVIFVSRKNAPRCFSLFSKSEKEKIETKESHPPQIETAERSSALRGRLRNTEKRQKSWEKLTAKPSAEVVEPEKLGFPVRLLYDVIDVAHFVVESHQRLLLVGVIEFWKNK